MRAPTRAERPAVAAALSSAAPRGRAALAAALGCAAAALVFAATRPPGPGLDPDALSYVGPGESLARSGALRIPVAQWWSADSTAALVHFPPGFAIAIAAPTALGVPATQSARIVEAVAGGVTIAVVAWMVAGVAGSAAGVVAALVVAATPALLDVHTRVLSEPLFFTCLVVTLALMVRAPNRPLRYGMAAAAAVAVRYAAVGVTGAAVLWALGRRSAPRAHVRAALLAALPTLVVQGAWVLRAGREQGRVRTFGLQRGLGTPLADVLFTIHQWLAPSVAARMAPAVSLVVAAAGTLLIGRAASRLARTGASPHDSAPPGAGRLLGATALVAVCYAAALAMSRVVVADRGIIEGRLLAPLILLADVAAVLALVVCWRGWPRPARAAAAVVVTAWLVGVLQVDVDKVRRRQREGWGYARQTWRQSPLVAWIRTEGRRYQLFSNNPMVIYFRAGRPSRELPRSLAPDSVRAFGTALARRGGAMIGFARPYTTRMASPDTLAARLSLRPLARFRDGAVWVPAGERTP